MLRFAIALLLTGSVAACAAGSGGGRVSTGFPRAETLEEIGARPIPTPQRVEPVADVETWILSGRLPAQVASAPHLPANGWDRLFDELVRARPKLRGTEAMSCVARELAGFQLANAGRAAEDLQRFVVARCGSATVSVQALVTTFSDLTGELAEEQLVTTSRASLEQSLDSVVAMGGEWDVGLAFVRVEDRGLLLLTVGARMVDLEPVPMAVARGEVVVRGTLRTHAEALDAYVSRGRFEAAECRRDDSLALPQFAFTCRVDPKDATAWIEIAALPSDRILSYEVAALLVGPGGKEPPGVYRRPALQVAAAGGSGEDLAEGFLAALNAVRREAGLLEIRATAAQTEVAQRVAPHFFASSFGLVPTTVGDQIALGLLAGWRVDATVHDGLLTSAWTGQSADPRRLLASMLDSPGGRTVLLDRDADVISIGTVTHPDRRFLGALVTVYRIYEYLSPEMRAKQVLARVTELRAEKSLAPPAKIAGLSREAEAAIARIETDRLPPRRALQAFLQDATTKARRPVQGFVFETRDLSDFELPKDLAEAAYLPLEIAVAYHRPSGEPWGRWVVLLVTFPGTPA